MQDLMVTKEKEEQLERKDGKVQRVPQESLVNLVRMENLVSKDPLVLQAKQETQESRA